MALTVLPRVLFAVALLSGPLAAAAVDGSPFTAIHPEEAYPDNPQETSADPYTDLVKALQQRLNESGFSAGPANGDLGGKTQAALVQFQIANNIPASGALDDATLKALGLEQEAKDVRSAASS